MAVMLHGELSFGKGLVNIDKEEFTKLLSKASALEVYVAESNSPAKLLRKSLKPSKKKFAMIIHFTGGKNTTLGEYIKIGEEITELFDEETIVLWDAISKNGQRKLKTTLFVLKK